MMAGKCNVFGTGLMEIAAGLLYLTVVAMAAKNEALHDYGDALSKCILFYEGQRSGKLPPTQRMTWRKDSALHDGSDIGMDMTGGYYDAGDNVKFHFPMAFTTTMLAWSVIEFGEFMGSELKHALDAIRWGTDYFLKATSIPNVVVAQIGDPISDHNCCERPEDMDTARTSYSINSTKPGSEVSAEIAAALAASSIAFKSSDASYSHLLLNRSFQVFNFADKHRGSYNDSVGRGVCPFYCDFSGYMDELVWGAAWLYKATNAPYYCNYVRQNIHEIENNDRSNGDGSIYEFGWDTKNAGINILVSQWAMKHPPMAEPFIPYADKLVCSILPLSPAPKSVSYSPGGLLFKVGGSNLQHATSLSFLLLAYSRYMEGAGKVINCGSFSANPSTLVDFAKGQVDYILGTNPLGMSYMVGFGQKFPQFIHHRGSVLPSMDRHPRHMQCHEGDAYFKSSRPNINLLVGAVIGGPAEDDSFKDSRFDVAQSEPTTYINAPFVGVLAYIKGIMSK